MIRSRLHPWPATSTPTMRRADLEPKHHDSGEPCAVCNLGVPPMDGYPTFMGEPNRCPYCKAALHWECQEYTPDDLGWCGRCR